MPFSFFRKKSVVKSAVMRIVYVNQKAPPDTVVPKSFTNNKIVTSKYTVYNFIFKNLFEQFRRIANFYFLTVSIIQLSIRGPVSPATSITPLLFVVIVTAVKQGYEDWGRHKSDNCVNHAPTTVCRFGKFSAKKVQEIKVGDIVQVNNNEEAPCDLVLLSSSAASNKCQITTANLDGETNLKVHECSDVARIYNPLDEYDDKYAVIECDSPNPDLYKFEGKITIISSSHEETFALDFINLFPKGASLKNTEYVYGCAVYTGNDTKVVLNNRLTYNKFSIIEKTLNKFLAVFIVILLVASCVATALLHYYNTSYFIDAWYIPTEESDSVIVSIINEFLSFAVLMNYIIPISLYVTLELIKFIGCKFFVWDLDFYDEKSNEPAVCNTSDLNEDLGQIQHLFSDKTGTLTENKMVFRKCYVDGVQYEECDGKLRLCESGFDLTCDSESLKHFLIVLALCNDVQIQSPPSFGSVSDKSETHFEVQEPLTYISSSPDEKALVEACARFGTALIEITNQQCAIETCHGTKIHKKLCILEFNSTRKRMSTIIEDDEGNIHLYCKGADSAVLKLVGDSDTTDVEEQIVRYSQAGLRTLVVAEKPLDIEEFNEFEKRLNKARCSMVNRQEQVSDVFNTIETDLKVIGVTAVEDRLQAGVPHTLRALRKAGIKVWILTGDHHETALNISYSCGHIRKSARKYSVLHAVDSEDCYFTLKDIKSRLKRDTSQTSALIIDGQSLVFALNDHLELLRTISLRCVAVLCCRMSPLQKAQIVNMIKKSADSPITAAIGDGANDVSMIQEANIGLGIIGKEGRQAVMSSDFAFAKFRFLEKALLIHGQYFYVRAAQVIQYFFYKNIAFVLPIFIYLFFNGFTPQTLYDNAFLMLYNILLTSLPIFIYGFTEKHQPEKILLANPESYRSISGNCYLTIAEFTKWILLGCWHSLIIFFGIYLLYEDPVLSTGHTIGLWSLGTIMFHVVVITVNLKLALHTKFWTMYFAIALLVTITGFVGFTMLYTQVYWSTQTSALFGVYYTVMSIGRVWLLTLILAAIALLPDIVIDLMEYHTFSLKRSDTIVDVEKGK